MPVGILAAGICAHVMTMLDQAKVYSAVADIYVELLVMRTRAGMLMSPIWLIEIFVVLQLVAQTARLRFATADSRP